VKRRLLIALALALGHCGPAVASRWVFLSPGLTHAGESPDVPGRGWLALHRVGETWVLSPTRVKAKRVDSSLAEYDVEISSGRRDALALIRLPDVQPGAVRTPAGWERFLGLENGAHPSAGTVKDAATGDIWFNGMRYRFELRKIREKLSADQEDGSTDEWLSSPLDIVAGKRRTSIGESGAFTSSDDMNRIIWMGDLDRDGRLDFIVDTGGKNSSGLCLYVSKGANGSELLKAPYCHIGTGC
jgi:hypothetical protein